VFFLYQFGAVLGFKCTLEVSQAFTKYGSTNATNFWNNWFSHIHFTHLRIDVVDVSLSNTFSKKSNKLDSLIDNDVSWHNHFRSVHYSHPMKRLTTSSEHTNLILLLCFSFYSETLKGKNRCCERKCFKQQQLSAQSEIENTLSSFVSFHFLQQKQQQQQSSRRFLHTFEHGFRLNGTSGAVDGARLAHHGSNFTNALAQSANAPPVIILCHSVYQ